MLLHPSRVTCPRCLAKPGQDCTTPNGIKARAPHRARNEMLAFRIRRRETFRVRTTQGDPVRGILPNHEYSAIMHPASLAHVLILGPVPRLDCYSKLHDVKDCAFVKWNNPDRD